MSKPEGSYVTFGKKETSLSFRCHYISDWGGKMETDGKSCKSFLLQTKKRENLLAL